MPFMNGIEMSKLIKKLNDKIKIIFTSAYNDIEYLKEAIKVKVEEYLIKPINLKELINHIVDIQKNIELEYQEKIHKHEVKIASMSELMNDIAHHWRQPLSVITSSIATIQLKSDLNQNITQSDVHEAYHQITKSCKFLSNTIDMFNKYLHTSNIVEKKLDLNTRIEHAVSKILDSFNAHNIDLSIHNENNTNVKLSEEVEQVLINIFQNAEDIFLERKSEKPFVQLDVMESNDTIIISVEDNGGGIAEENLDRIFEPYFTTKHKAQNVGLSLSQSYMIITKLYHGNIYATNTMNGAKIFIELPKS